MKMNLFVAAIIVTNLSVGHAQTTTTSTSTSRSTSSTGKNYAEAETNSSFAFSSTFQKNVHAKINDLISSKFPQFDGHTSVYKNNGLEYKIELKENAVKLEFKSDKNSMEANSIKAKIKSLATQIKGLNSSK
ncbi:hypothetical protein [Rhizosphaericola mali]|uniref:DUF3568 family protein n=1 Tax=Rhizosphaericola mali TaxID=2545455 RepID=A0A5P2G1U3_9BACT|nr:hypothetical protein [Rhizosphaericola mali]QES89764.1 hypothetical protein E0W69_014205 [Rhizosphaericola mali]